MTQVFISYSRKDLEFVDRLANDLKATGFEVWYDLSGLEAGTRWGNEIQKAIQESQYFLVVLSPNSVKSDWVEREFLYASDKDLKIIPLLYQPCSLPMWSLNLHFIDMQGKNYALHYQDLLKVMGVKTGSEEENPIAIRYIEIGDEYRKRGQVSQAIESYQQALAVDPGNLKAHSNIGAVQLTEQAFAEAAAAYELALQISSEDLVVRAGFCDANMALGNQARADGRIEDAIHYYLEILRIDSQEPDARKSLANIYTSRAESSLAAGQEDEGLSALSEAIKYSPDDSSLTSRLEKMRSQKKARIFNGLMARAEAEISSGNWDQALSLLTEIVAIEPQDGSILKKIEEIKQQQLEGQLETILSKVDRAEQARRWDTALAGLNEYLHLKPADKTIQKRMADLMRSKHDTWLSTISLRVDQAVEKQNWDEALAILNEALQLEPDNEELLARAEHVKQVQRNTEVKATILRADQAAGAGRWDDAIEILSRGLAGYPAEATLTKKIVETRRAKQESIHQTALRLANVAARAGKWETALASLNEVLASEPDNLEFLQKRDQLIALERESRMKSLKTKAHELLEAEKFDEALALWNEALTQDAENRQAILHEIEMVLKAQNLENDYIKATQAFSAKNYKKACDLFNNILLEQDGYKNAAKLLVKANRMQRSAQRSPVKDSKKRWVIGGSLVVLALGIAALVFWLKKEPLPTVPVQVTNETATLAIPQSTSSPVPQKSPTPQGVTLTVNSAEDSGPGTLRQAILDARAWDTITFDPLVFPPDDPATIYVTSDEGLPRIEQGKITIDASNAGVILDGSKIQSGAMGLVLSSDGNTIMGLQIFSFGAGIYLEGGSYNTIGGDRNIGDGPLGQGNLLANCYNGIDILASSGGNTITDNLIGTDLNGSESVGNMKAGIRFEGEPPFNAAHNVVGPNNIITNNGEVSKINMESNYGGIVIDSEWVAVTITENNIFGNAGPGITFSPEWGAEQFVYSTPPTILYFELDPGLVAGQTCPNCVVELFSTETQDGKVYEGVVTADEFGNFVFNKNEPLSGPYLTATTRPPGENTSEFSLATPARSDVQIALDAVWTQKPVFETAFDTWMIGEPKPNVRLEDGKLIISGQSDELIFSHTKDIFVDKFAVEVEVNILDSGKVNGQCEIWTNPNEAGDSVETLVASFKSSGQVALYHSGTVTHNWQYVAVDGITFNFTEPVYVTLVVVGNQIAVFVDGQVTYFAFNPDGNQVYRASILVANGPVTCEFDNYKLWDLSEVNFNP